MAARPRVEAPLLAAVVLAAAVAAALASGPSGGGVMTWSESLSGRLSAALGGVGAALPFGYAFAAGMLAAVNPCGFALVPAYLGSYLWPDGSSARWRLLVRAIGFSAAVTAGFVVLFGTAGLLLGGIGAAAVRSLPWLGLMVGVVLAAAGAAALAGGPSPSIAAGQGLAGFLGRAAARPGPTGYAAYGVVYGLASLGCALPVFLSVVGGAMTQGPLVAAGLFVLYGLGLGAVLSAAAVTAAALGTGIFARLGRVGRATPVAGAALLLVAGAYVTYYWLTAGGVLADLGA